MINLSDKEIAAKTARQLTRILRLPDYSYDVKARVSYELESRCLEAK